MRADVDVRDLRVPEWARFGVLLGALLHLGLGITLLVWPQAELFSSISRERLALRAIGVFALAVGAGLIAAFQRPARHSAFVAVGAASMLAAVASLSVFVVPHADWSATWQMLVMAIVGLLLLGLSAFAIRRTPETAVTIDDIRPVGTTTLFGLQQTLQALAAPATVQLTMFPDLVANGERVMADFKLWRERALQKQDLLSAPQQGALVGLDAALQRMLQDSAVNLWNAEAVSSSPEWGQLRASARRALVAFAWSVDMPMGVLKRKRESSSSVDLRPPTVT